MSVDEQLLRLRKIVVDSANAHLEEGGDFTPARIEKIIDGADVVFAVWQDRNEPDGVGMRLVKGAAMLQQNAARYATFTARIAGLPCNDVVQAMGIFKLFGEKDQRH